METDTDTSVHKENAVFAPRVVFFSVHLVECLLGKAPGPELLYCDVHDRVTYVGWA